MKCWGWGRYTFKKNSTRIFCWKPAIRGEYRPWSTAKSAGKCKIRPIPSLSDMLWMVQNSSIHPSSCKTGSETNQNGNALPILHIIQHIQCYIQTHTHTHTIYKMMTRSTSVKINQTLPLLSHNMMKLHQISSCQAKSPGPVAQW